MTVLISISLPFALVAFTDELGLAGFGHTTSENSTHIANKAGYNKAPGPRGWSGALKYAGRAKPIRKIQKNLIE